jgi:arginine N-succinyltransferase
MLARIGFRYAQRVDPFDGGPHFVASTDDVPLVRDVRGVELASQVLALPPLAPALGVLGLAGLHYGAAPYFVARAAMLEASGVRLLGDPPDVAPASPSRATFLQLPFDDPA